MVPRAKGNARHGRHARARDASGLDAPRRRSAGTSGRQASCPEKTKPSARADQPLAEKRPQAIGADQTISFKAVRDRTLLGGDRERRPVSPAKPATEAPRQKAGYAEGFADRFDQGALQIAAQGTQ